MNIEGVGSVREIVGAGWWWLKPVILATQEAEIRGIMVLSQSGQIICETLSQTNLSLKRADGVA
jgi:hypothetical protein